ncbi:MAG: TraR/DksA C4-type zinc finger protein [Patescibacteria group bacterium]
MEQKVLQELKELLNQRREEIIKQLESIGTRNEGEEVNFSAEFPDYGDSSEDSAVEVADYTKNLSFERGLEKDLHGVEKALKRLEEGTYGKCNYCGKEIELERLKIRPESTACVACKKALKGEA